MTLPLSGIRVLDFSRFLPGAYFGWIAGDMGADIIRVEHPRELAKHEAMFGKDDDEAAALRRRARPTYHRNKRSIVINPGHPQARTVLDPLIESADILVEDYRPGTMAKMGLDYDSVRRINPQLIYGSVSFAGQTGVFSDRAGHDPAALAAAGVLSRLNGLPTPSLPGVQVADVMSGSHATIALLLALQSRAHTGAGSHVDVSMIDASMPLLMVGLGRAAPQDIPPPDVGWHPKGGVWQCGDGEWLCTTDMEPRYWARFCEAIGRPEFAERQFDMAAHPQMHAELTELFATRPRDEWVALFEAADTQAMPVLSPAEALRHPNSRSRDMHVELDLGGEAGSVEQIGTPFRLSDTGPLPRRAASMPGTDRDAILRELGLDAAAIARMDEAGIFSSMEGARR